MFTGQPGTKILATVEAQLPTGLDAAPDRDPLRRILPHRTPVMPLPKRPRIGYGLQSPRIRLSSNRTDHELSFLKFWISFLSYR